MKVWSMSLWTQQKSKEAEMIFIPLSLFSNYRIQFAADYFQFNSLNNVGMFGVSRGTYMHVQMENNELLWAVESDDDWVNIASLNKELNFAEQWIVLYCLDESVTAAWSNTSFKRWI